MWRSLPGLVLLLASAAHGQQPADGTDIVDQLPAIKRLLLGKFTWKTGRPVILPSGRQDDPCHAIKDPTVVFFDGKWHVFATIRSQKRTHQIEYLSFADWKDANAAKRHVLTVTDGYFCAPQVFYFSPHKKWYLIYQASDKSRQVELQPAYSTSEDISNPQSWTKPVFLFDKHPENVRMWIDFWVICDDSRAHLFFTSLDGQMWRAETSLEKFPRGWGIPVQCLKGDIFEASHTYKLAGMDKYVTIVEAQDGGRRYYKAYIADKLNAGWTDLATRRGASAFASRENVKQIPEEKWTDSISHGELLRVGFDQKMEVDPLRLRFLFQGVSDDARAGKGYGQIPWKLGILEIEEPAEKEAK